MRKHTLLKRCMSQYTDMLNEQWDKCLNLATYALISHQVLIILVVRIF